MATNKIRFNAVVRCLPALDDSAESERLYHWRRCNEQGRWIDSAEQGTAGQLANRLPAAAEIALVVPGTEVVTQRVTYTETERKHLARLVPFQMEEHLTTELEDTHFALGEPEGGEVTAAYINREWLTERINELEGAGLEVHECLIEPLMLPRLERGWTLRLDERLHVHYGPNLGFSVEPVLATAALVALTENQAIPEQLLLMAAEQDGVEQLHDLLPPSLRDQLGREQIDVQLADEWDGLALDRYDGLDLRQGELARRLPLRKWWQDWRNVSILAAVALFVYVGVNVAYIQITQARETEVRRQIVAAYREAVPAGAVANPEQQLRTQIAKYEGGGDGSQVIPMLAKIAPVFAQAEDVSLLSLNYNNQRREMRINLQAKSYDAIRDLTQSIEQKNLRADLRNSGQRGDLQQAIIVISGGDS